MCKSPLHPLLAALPKVEAHIHLEGALTPDLLFSLSAANSIPLPPTPEFASPATLLARYANFSSLNDFLHYYYLSLAVLRTAADFEALAWSYFQHAHADRVLHADVFFDPQAHTARGVPYATVVAGFERARLRAERDLGVTATLVLCFLRHLPAADAALMLETARPDLQRGTVRGVGLDSSEVGFPASLFAEVFAAAAAIPGVRRTAHAGEEGGPEMVWEALGALGLERVDHGVSIARDTRLLAEVARRGLLVTLCPLSNVCLKVVGSVREVPVRRFLEAGVRFSLNSDDPAYFGGWCLENWCAVQEEVGLSVREWEGVSRAGIEGAWCGEGRKEELRGVLGEVMERFGDLREG